MNYVLSVSEINRYIKELISKDMIMSGLWVRGEISNYKYHYSGHMYFTLKDEKCLIKCVMFKSHASALKFEPENGGRVIIKGYVSVFERDGQYQLYVEEMQPDGIGNLHMAFEQLKKKLFEEGLFDEANKKRLPFLPRAVGIVTSSTGSVVRDIINISSRRFREIELKIFPVAVQGEQAAGQISGAIKKLNRLGCVDVIILARGGGSLEELWAFNEEVVARSIFNSVIPVVSAVGHETDYTISDFVADVRAPTPSAAAEIVIPERAVLKERIMLLEARLKNGASAKIQNERAQLERLRASSAFRQPYDRLYQERMRLDTLNRYMHKAMLSVMEKKRSDLSLLIGKLDALSPLSIMSRGYGVIRSLEDGEVVRSVKAVRENERLSVELFDGKIICRAEDIKINPGL
ncbi:exodeoxyribonuclease VII large subunit [Anaerobacterium chartisolvens]|uniref:Exodeoxyribonuclease 7 large subunit n=1 Tax=Anaerobacterium chartisolvens TaxID=1297424 RepID=A0A369B5L2_9FIRM|nr:exodeoxyribonuclease VII large subunit [Anaerobacterium chartisolvens]RCX16802.1 exodeoxyribonuclease VII large subunit [Anaerobacterium chartisolvens]